MPFVADMIIFPLCLILYMNMDYGIKYDEVGLSIFPEQPSLACQPYIVTAFWHRMKKAMFVRGKELACSVLNYSLYI